MRVRLKCRIRIEKREAALHDVSEN
jgi:hypothetical protein